MMIDLYRKKLPSGVLYTLCRQIRNDTKKFSLDKSYCPKGVCAGGIVKPLSTMNGAFPVVYLLQLVMDEVLLNHQTTPSIL